MPATTALGVSYATMDTLRFGGTMMHFNMVRILETLARLEQAATLPQKDTGT